MQTVTNAKSDSVNYQYFWGIDVSKSWLDISIDGKVERIEQKEKDINNFIKKT